MFRVQSLFETCSANGTVTFQVSVPISGVESGYEAFAILPDGSAAALPILEGQAILEHTGGPGLHRFDVRVAKQGNRDEVVAYNIIEVALIPESPQSVCDELTKTVESMSARYSGDLRYGDMRVTAESDALFQVSRGAELPEIVRRICFESSNPTNLLRNLLLLENLAQKPCAKPYLPIIAAAATRVLCDNRLQDIVITAFRILNQVSLPPKEKWFYYTSLIADGPINAAGIISGAVAQLLNGTPLAARPTILSVAYENIGDDLNKVSFLAPLFKEWKYTESIPRLLVALEMNANLASSICPVLRECNYREAIPILRKVLSSAPLGAGGIAIIELLVGWQDAESIPVIIKKIEEESSTHHIGSAVFMLREYGDKNIRIRLEEIKSISPATKAGTIEANLKNW